MIVSNGLARFRSSLRCGGRARARGQMPRRGRGAGGRACRQPAGLAYEFFVILEGTARVEQDGEPVATLGPGDFFGELGLLATGRRTAAVVAETPMRMLATFDQRFRRLERDLPALSEAIRTEMRARFSKPNPAPSG